MCVGKPKVPKVPEIPDRRAAVLPDAGNPATRMAARNRNRAMASAMIFTQQGNLGSASTSAPSTGG